MHASDPYEDQQQRNGNPNSFSDISSEQANKFKIALPKQTPRGRAFRRLRVQQLMEIKCF
jgi:hypothetical protein